MATIRLIPSTYTRSNATYVKVTDPENMYHNTNNTTYASIRGRNRAQNVYYAFIRGFNFGDIPSGSTINSFAVKIKAYQNGELRTGSTVRARLASSPSSSSAISGTELDSDFGTTSTLFTFPNGSLTWNTIAGYGSNFSIEIILQSNSSRYPYLYVYGAEIEVDYTAEDVHPTSVTLDQNAVSLEEGDTVQLTETVLPSNATNKNVTWSSSDTSVATVSNGLVSAVSAGSATITVTTVDGGETATCAITVAQGMKVSMKVNGEWVQGTNVFIKQSGSWVQATKIYVKDNGSWES